MAALRRLEFSAFCDTLYGQLVYICGNIPELGNWNPLKGLRLYTQEAFYPIWKSFDPILVIQNQPIQFKIVIVTSKCEYKWENIKQNRIIIPEIDAYIKLTVNEFETYQIFPFCDGDDLVRTGIDILNDLSSDGSSSISFKSNYKFFEYYKRKDDKRHQSPIKSKNTSTFRDLGPLQGQKPGIKTQKSLVTFIDSLMELERDCISKQITTQECSGTKVEQEVSHSTSSDNADYQQQKFKREDWIQECAGKTLTAKNLRSGSKKGNLQPFQRRLTSLNKIIYSNSSESLSFGRQQ